MTGEEKERRGPSPDDFKQILTLFSEKVPALLNNLAEVLYGKEQSVKYGQAVAGFYKTLKDSGMTDEQAYELTKQYMSAMNIPGMIGQAIGKGRGGGFGFKFKKGEAKDGDGDDEAHEE
ncbi:MAG TPA: hypothetical protein VEM95_04875 [Thermoplasmata archaeon]|nr:hypothetical protein [Thermoplasmata archaeon]